ncbi:MAG: Fic family protein [bacterium]|nr:Fic family protein [bacterium]
MGGRGWRPIEPLDRAVETVLGRDLATLDAVHRSWQEHRTEFGRVENTYPLHRTYRKHAIETGIIEGLYDLDRPTTDVMVIKGITRGADTADEEVPPGVLRMLRAHKEGFEMVFELARAGRPLTSSFIRELHALITRAQPFCFLTDPTGRFAQVMMDHGSFKRFPNRARRADGTILSFAPPAQVDGEIRRLINLYETTSDVHPVVVAAWLHHRFAQIHPFQDGNGRVGRALAALPLERAQYPPIVVDRNCRDVYLLALDEANNGDLVPLARLFAELALRSIRREFDESILDSFAGMALEEEWLLNEVADPEQLDLIDQAKETGAKARMRADRLHDHIWDWLRAARVDIDQEFAEAGQEARVWTDRPMHFDRRDRWWRREIIRTAKTAEHYACFKPRAWWSKLGMSVNGVDLRFVTSIHHVASPYTGVMAITSFGRIRIRGQEFSGPDDVFVETSWEPFTFSHHENIDDRVGDLDNWLDQSLAVALRKFVHLTLGG